MFLIFHVMRRIISRMEEKIAVKRKRGRGRGLVTEKYTLQLEPLTAEWAKEQPGGLSERVRQWLRQAYDEAQRNKKPEKSQS